MEVGALGATGVVIAVNAVVEADIAGGLVGEPGGVVCLAVSANGDYGLTSGRP